jgi:hypothetical protein
MRWLTLILTAIENGSGISDGGVKNILLELKE